MHTSAGRERSEHRKLADRGTNVEKGPVWPANCCEKRVLWIDQVPEYDQGGHELRRIRELQNCARGSQPYLDCCGTHEPQSKQTQAAQGGSQPAHRTSAPSQLG